MLAQLSLCGGGHVQRYGMLHLNPPEARLQPHMRVLLYTCRTVHLVNLGCASRALARTSTSAAPVTRRGAMAYMHGNARRSVSCAAQCARLQTSFGSRIQVKHTASLHVPSPTQGQLGKQGVGRAAHWWQRWQGGGRRGRGHQQVGSRLEPSQRSLEGGGATGFPELSVWLGSGDAESTGRVTKAR